MKKPLCFILSALLLFAACSKKPQEEPEIPDEPELPKEIDSLAAALWDYPIKQGTEEWYRLQTEQERINAEQVPKEVLEKITTKKLVELVITFPSFDLFVWWDTPQMGFDRMVERYNIFECLFSSKEAGKYLVAVYKDAGMSGFKTLPYSNEGWPIKLRYIELLLSQKEILQSLTTEEKFELLLAAREKFSEKMGNENFSTHSAKFTLRIMARILDMEEYEELYLFSNWKEINQLIQTGFNIPPIEELIEIVDNYINEKNKIL